MASVSVIPPVQQRALLSAARGRLVTAPPVSRATPPTGAGDRFRRPLLRLGRTHPVACRTAITLPALLLLTGCTHPCPPPTTAAASASPSASAPLPELVLHTCPPLVGGGSLVRGVALPGVGPEAPDAQAVPVTRGIGPCWRGALYYTTDQLPMPGWSETMRCVDSKGRIQAEFIVRVAPLSPEHCEVRR